MSECGYCCFRNHISPPQLTMPTTVEPVTQPQHSKHDQPLETKATEIANEQSGVVANKPDENVQTIVMRQLVAA